jgi:hypothetical protein
LSSRLNIICAAAIAAAAVAGIVPIRERVTVTSND